MSSAYLWSWISWRVMMVSRGAVYTLNNMGPRTDPCGTPNFRGNSLDVQEPILMLGAK